VANQGLDGRHQEEVEVMGLPKSRPAETSAGVAGALAVLLCAIFGVDDPTIYGALVIVIGFIPALVTWIVLRIRRDNLDGGTTYQAPGSGTGTTG
jgi:hypothetical protein